MYQLARAQLLNEINSYEGDDFQSFLVEKLDQYKELLEVPHDTLVAASESVEGFEALESYLISNEVF